MSKLFLILAVICGLGAAALGYLNNQAFEEGKKQLADAMTQAEAAKTEAAKYKKDSDAAKAKAQEAEAAKAAAESALASKESELKVAKDEAENIRAQIATKDSEIGELKAKLEQAIQAQTGSADQATASATPSEVEDLRAQVAELETLKQSLTSRLQGAESRVKSLEEAEAARVAGLMRKSTEGRILAVNQAYNFVVLSLGDRQGAVENAEMLIKRGGNLIGKARITSVERGQSIADVDRDTVPKGIQIQPGDVVVFPGT